MMMIVFCVVLVVAMMSVMSMNLNYDVLDVCDFCTYWPWLFVTSLATEPRRCLWCWWRHVMSMTAVSTLTCLTHAHPSPVLVRKLVNFKPRNISAPLFLFNPRLVNAYTCNVMLKRTWIAALNFYVTMPLVAVVPLSRTIGHNCGLAVHINIYIYI